MNIFKKTIGVIVISVLALMVSSSAVFAVTPSTVYNNIPNPYPSNVPSVGAEAYAFNEFGGQVQLTGTARHNPTVTVLMSSWACQNGNWLAKNCTTTPGATHPVPITLHVYSVGLNNAPGTSIATVTQTFVLPYRPSTDTTNCTGDNAGKWFDGTSCYNGKAANISFSLAGVTLPDKVIVSLTYNTSHFGYTPIGETACNTTPEGCFYDSLNIGLAYPPSVGTTPLPDSIYQYSSYGGAYCDSGAGGTSTFRLDAGCWTGYQPTFKIEATAATIPVPTTKDQCKNDGWKNFNNPSFKNQGDCVSFVATNSKNQ